VYWQNKNKHPVTSKPDSPLSPTSLIKQPCLSYKTPTPLFTEVGRFITQNLYKFLLISLFYHKTTNGSARSEVDIVTSHDIPTQTIIISGI
jgi:hypothetical protein